MARIVEPPVPPNKDTCLRTHAEIAAIMTDRGYPMCRGRVWQIEQAALKKIAASSLIHEVAAEIGFIIPETAKTSR